MPLLAFCKQWFHPHAAFAHGFLIGWCLVVALHTFKRAGMERPMDLTTLMTRGTLRFEGACIAGGSISAIFLRPFRVAVRFQAQYGSVWACIDILIGIVLKLPLPEERGSLVKVRQGHIGTDVL